MITSVVVAIDTDSYAGNFEREMCAYITGRVGECGVGDEMAEIASKELPESVMEEFEEIVVEEPDDSEFTCHRPCSIWTNSENVYNSVAIFFNDTPSEEILDLIEKRAIEFANKRPDYKSFMGNKKPIKVFSVRVLVPKLVKPRKIEHELFLERKMEDGKQNP